MVARYWLFSDSKSSTSCAVSFVFSPIDCMRRRLPRRRGDFEAFATGIVTCAIYGDSSSSIRSAAGFSRCIFASR